MRRRSRRFFARRRTICGGGSVASMVIGPNASEPGSDPGWSVAEIHSRAARIDAIAPAALASDVAALPHSQRLGASGGFQVYWAHPSQSRGVLHAIGRLRELTFRAVGEGSGKSCDLDFFDTYYLHLFVWDAQANAVVGAYRLGLVEDILAQYGKRGLYTHSLFRYGPRILNMLKPAIELGRSFVRAEYQRSVAPMLLLWRGIGRFIQLSPQYAVLFGPVSISNSYSPASRALMVEYLSGHMAETRMLMQVKPRRPFLAESTPMPDEALPVPGSIDELSRMVEHIEADGKGIPVLLRQYLRLG